MTSTIQLKSGRLFLENERVVAEFLIDGGLRLVRFQDGRSGEGLGAQEDQTLLLNRSAVNLAGNDAATVALKEVNRLLVDGRDVGCVACVQCVLPVMGGTLVIDRRFFLYEDTGALRWYDTWSTDVPLHGLRYSDLFQFTCAASGSARCIDFFTCSDQSNERVLEHPAAVRNQGSYFIHEGGTGLFLYKEGPCPDSQPVKTAYDFLYDHEAKHIAMVGLGFDDLLPGEARRANGVVLGILEDGQTLMGLKRYQAQRYRLTKQEPPEYLANSWPAFFLNVSEEKILKELEVASEIGVDTVFIDDGWFETFMGDVDRAKFPTGFDAVSKKANALGLKVGLWMDPLGMDSRDPQAKAWDGAECHDTVVEGNPWNWVARSNDFTPVEAVFSEGTRIYYGMDLLNPDYFAHIRDKVIALYNAHGIERFKFDLYQLSRYDTLLGDTHLHYEAYRQLLDELRAAIPGLVVSMDVTRRNRPCFDFGMDYGRLFLENRGRRLKDHRYYQPYTSLGNLWRLARYFPPGRCELEVMAQAEEYSVAYLLSTTLFAHPLYWGSLQDLSPERRVSFRAFVEVIRPHKQALLDGVAIPIGEPPAQGSWSGFLSLTPGGAPAYLAIYRNGASSGRCPLELPKALMRGPLSYSNVFNPSDRGIFMGPEIACRLSETYDFRLFTLSPKE
jgi:hypothetical protein